MNPAIFNPALKLDEAGLAEMRELSVADIAELAKQYPNQPRGNAYLILFDTSLPADKQIGPLSTWQNLASLHKMGKTNYRPHAFRGGVGSNPTIKTAVTKIPRKTRTLDLSSEELNSAPGLKGESPIDTLVDNNPATSEDNNGLVAYKAAEKAHADAIEAGAHPNTVRALKKKMDEAAEKAGI